MIFHIDNECVVFILHQDFTYTKHCDWMIVMPTSYSGIYLKIDCPEVYCGFSQSIQVMLV